MFYGNVKSGKLTINSVDIFRDYLRSIPDGDVKLSVRKCRPDRSNPQNRYYQGIIVKILSDELGYEKDEIHEIVKWRFLRETKEIKGTVYEYSRSTASLNTAEFEEFLEQCRRWALKDLEIYLPLPREVDY